MFYSLLAMWVVALFYVLGDTADTYFCPVLARLSTEMGLRPHLAGITCLRMRVWQPERARTHARRAPEPQHAPAPRLEMKASVGPPA